MTENFRKPSLQSNNAVRMTQMPRRLELESWVSELHREYGRQIENWKCLTGLV